MIEVQCGNRTLLVETDGQANWVKENCAFTDPDIVYKAVTKAQSVLDEARGNATKVSVGAASSGSLASADPDVFRVNTRCYIFARDCLSKHHMFVEGPDGDRFYMVVE